LIAHKGKLAVLKEIQKNFRQKLPTILIFNPRKSKTKSLKM